ncbi:MAG: hypothetical protein IT434_17990, partial [Phycisphaerales bacterium]|nr:hypothetical protein [Phycisphaerales bacterium]
MERELDDEQRETLRSWITPTTTEVLITRSRIVLALGAQPMSLKSLSSSLGVDRGAWRFEVATFEYPKVLLGDVLTASDPRIEAVRLYAAFVEAMHQLESERVIETTPA